MDRPQHTHSAQTARFPVCTPGRQENNVVRQSPHRPVCRKNHPVAGEYLHKRQNFSFFPPLSWSPDMPPTGFCREPAAAPSTQGPTLRHAAASDERPVSFVNRWEGARSVAGNFSISSLSSLSFMCLIKKQKSPYSDREHGPGRNCAFAILPVSSEARLPFPRVGNRRMRVRGFASLDLSRFAIIGVWWGQIVVVRVCLYAGEAAGRVPSFKIGIKPQKIVNN